MRISHTQLQAKIDYHGRFPTNYKFTSFAAWFAVTTFGSDGQPEGDPRFEDLIDCDRDGDAPEDNKAVRVKKENEWKTVWTGLKTCEAGLFLRTRFVVRATDYNAWLAASAKTGNVVLYPIPFATKERIPTFQGRLHIGRTDGIEDADIEIILAAKMSGETPMSLLEQAKRESSSNR